MPWSRSLWRGDGLEEGGFLFYNFILQFSTGGRTFYFLFIYYPQAYMIFLYCNIDSDEKICNVIAVGLNITKNLNVQANNNLYNEFSWINIAL